MKEEITDLIKDEAYEDLDFKKGTLLKFTSATIVVTRVDRKNHRTWGRHTSTVSKNLALSHYKHNVDITEETQKQYGAPYCTDCEIPLSQEATTKGKIKDTDRDERTLEDGTEIN